jgi:hypothetical protein
VEAMKTPESDSSKIDNLNYPYTAAYSSKFEIGDPNNSMTILNLYKDWDNNTLDNSKTSFAEMNDTLIMADGGMLTGSRDSIFATAGKMRGSMGTVQDVVQAWVPLKSIDKNENWVAIWTKEIRTGKNGKKDSSYLHEVWRFDKAGKVNKVYQFEQKSPAMMPSAKK